MLWLMPQYADAGEVLVMGLHEAVESSITGGRCSLYVRVSNRTSVLAGVSSTESQLAVGARLGGGRLEGDREQVGGDGALAEEVVGN